jgi:hypothetical protein
LIKEKEGNRLSVMAAALVLAACASKPQEPAAERQVKVDSSNIVEVQKAGYKIVDKDGQKLYCKRDLNTGSHVRYTTSCLTEAEWTAMRDASRRSVEQISRERLPPRGN